MRERKSARLLVISPSRSVLLFRFVHRNGALAGDDYWATPGGGVEEGENFEQAAIRELREETGIEVDAVGAHLSERRFTMQLPSGEWVTSVEQYYLIQAQNQQLCRQGWTASEVEVMADHRWWSAEELRQTTDIVWPERLIETLESAGVFSAAPAHG
ncbi:NUDIX hydrolase [Pseudomonas sp. NPDC087612]|uniref:NUDIX hydrolase n=1 Tax=unclassified Pseudomonas TaxID=196821 RepID=UPI000886F663|nr:MULTISPECIES: NUDIX domain-containing protein [unclassified Pseudomonas]QVM94741.1 NUDIX domain-containing protein [Pseudomonas sp. SORT22]UVL58395.1 NUDIX domain-containing protein [Pseudomonas sp. B21-035]SDQ78838.1 NUDIX domain-containing protein [Pseudomonas sp. UC 17F4]